MKIRNILIAVSAILMTAAAAQAQPGKRYYINAGWQFNGTVANDFASSASGWGAYAEGGYYIMPRVAVGAFASFNTNNEYIPRKTYMLDGDAALTTDMDHSIFQIPFGATLRYRFNWSRLEPYVEAKLGANYAEQYAYMSTFAAKDSQWGFYMSPEAGLTWHPFRNSNFGFQFAVYYNYATNRSNAFGINGINNLGFKLGLSF